MSLSKYLLYIDILGFSEMVERSDPRIEILFDRIAELLVFKDDAIKTIVFSDTIICFLKKTPLTKDNIETMLMFLCEASQSLFYHCVQLQIVFRAILTFGEFTFRELEHFDSYYGKSLIYAYTKEKEINAMGLFVDKRISDHYQIFRKLHFSPEFDFVYPNSDFNIFIDAKLSDFPVNRILLEGPSMLDLDVKYLKFLKTNIENRSPGKVRSKYELTYALYKEKFSSLIEFLEKNNFDHFKLCPNADWSEMKETFPRSLYS